MIPLRSSERTYSTPVVTLVIILLNVLVFAYELSLPHWIRNHFIETYGIVPYQFRFSQALTSMFLHAGFFHIIGNMWFLWVFGRGIEDVFGHAKYLVFYLVCGVAAAFVHVFSAPYSPVPTVGASGAIAGVMGAYLVKFPRARIVTLVLIIVFITTLDLPAAFILIYWFVIQFFSGIGSIGYSQVSGGQTAWFAHIGGFVAGLLFAFALPARRRFRAWD